MGMPGNENIKAFDLTCSLNICIQRTPDIGVTDTGLTRRNTFVDESDRNVNFPS